MKDGLSPRPARTDLTDRELTKIIGGLLGGLVQMTDVQTLRDVVSWWADSDEAWESLEQVKKMTNEAVSKIQSASGPVNHA